MLVAHFPNHCLAHKSWPNTTCIVFCPRRLVIEFSLPILQWPGLAQVFWADGSPARFTHLGAFISARKEMTKFQGAALASEYLQAGFVRLEKPLVTEPF